MDKNNISADKKIIKSITGNTFLIKNNNKDSISFKSSLEIFNKEQALTFSEHYYSSGNLKEKSYFDENNILVKVIFYEETGEINYSYRYSRINNTICKEMFLADKDKWNSIITELDSIGKIVKEKYFDINGDLIREDLYKYDENNNLIFIEKGIMGSEAFVYNKNNQIKTRIVNSPSGTVLGEVYTYSYTKEGLLHKIEKLNDYIIILSYEYY